jgi:hypothetical protein
MPAKSKCTGPGSPEEQQRDSVAKVVKLESLGLVKREAAQADRRVCEAVITAKGVEMTNRIDKARDRILTAMLADWSPKDIAALATLLRQLADCALAGESWLDGKVEIAPAGLGDLGLAFVMVFARSKCAPVF